MNLKPKKRFQKAPSMVTAVINTKYGVIRLSPEKQRLYNTLRYYGAKINVPTLVVVGKSTKLFSDLKTIKTNTK